MQSLGPCQHRLAFVAYFIAPRALTGSTRDRATAPNQEALGFGARANVVRSTATSPNLGPYPSDHSKLSSSVQ